MPASGPVYQPTTVTYEQQTPENGSTPWTRPVSYLSQTVSSHPNRARLIQWLILAVSVFLISLGLVLMIDGIVRYTSAPQVPVDAPDSSGSDSGALIVAVIGGFLSIIGLMLLGIYIRSCRRRKSCTWWRRKDLGSGSNRENGVAASAAMNPSTDLLVTAQYAPVSEVAYQPPAALAAEERRELMASENKDCTSGEESDRMLESDPRIVLRPQSHIEETA